MSQLGLSPEEDIQLKTICEYLFFDQFKDYVSYNRFEQCFQPLFNNIPISMDKVFKSICGEKKKYLNYQRFINSYLLYKSNDPNIVPDLKVFFETLLNSILKKDNSFVGKPQEKTLSFTTPKACKKREFITYIKVLSGKDGAIHGIIMEYDSITEVKMYPNKIENDLLISLDMKLGYVDEKPILEKKIGKLEGLKEEFYRDGVTHVFGTISPKTNKINFIGFKCISGKTVFVGFPEGDGFLFGKFGMKFHEVKMQMNLEGIILLQPGFNTNRRTNFYLNTEANKLTQEDLKKDIIIQDEEKLSKLNDAIQIDQMITTPIYEENHFFNEKLLDEISGNDYKEVVNQNPREWILKDESEAPKTDTKEILTIDDALKEVEKEKEKSMELLKSGVEGDKKGRKRGKKKKDKKKEKARKAMALKLHVTKSLLDEKEKVKKKQKEEIEQIKNTTPISILRNKENYKKLEEKISQGIYDELTQLKGNIEADISQELIGKIVPQKEEEKENTEKEKDSENKTLPISKKVNLISKNMKGEVKTVIQKGVSTVQKQKMSSNVVILGDSDNTKETKLFCSEAQQLMNTLDHISNKFNKEKTIMRAGKSINPQLRWKIFGNKIKKRSGVFLLQTIGSILKAIKVLNEEFEGVKTISLTERMQLLRILKQNKNIVDFLSQEPQTQKESTPIKKETENKKEKEEEILYPSSVPEQVTTLPEIESKMAQINKLLSDKNIKPNDKKKLEQLNNLYLQQKNILIENKTEDAKDEIIEKNKIDVNKYLKEEEEKRKKAMEESQKKLQEEMQKEKPKAKGEISINEIKKEEKIKVFRNQEIYKGKDPWTDPLFKPEKASLCPYDKKGWILPKQAIENDIKNFKNFKWARVEDIFDSKDYSVFLEGISVDDIVQGSINDCYFLSTLGSLCKFPELVDKLFYFKEKTKEHIYGVYLYINGEKQLVLLDDFLPYVGVAFKQLAAGKSQENQIWVSLIEKAWAKINGNYIRIGCGGSPNEVFDVLTEAYSEEIPIKNNEEVSENVWNKLIDGEKKGFVMTAGTTGKDYIEEYGLEPAHAYTVLGIHEIKGERVIRLRNPWGMEEFNGDWSDYSSKWTDDLKKQYNYFEKDDGDFFMGYKDFIKYFVTMGFAKLHAKFSSSKIKIKRDEATKCQLIKVTIPEDDTLVYFQLFAKNPRIPNKKGEYPKFALNSLILVDKYFNYIGSSASSDMHICVESTLKKGEYYLFCDTNFRFNPTKGKHGYTVTAYSGVNIPLENVTDKNAVPDLLRKAMIDYCKKKEKPNPQKNGVNVYVTKAYNEDIPYIVLTFENTTDNCFSVSVRLQCRGSKSCCFYCDDIASENDMKVVKYLQAKQTNNVLIMYYSYSSIFDYSIVIDKTEEKKDSISSHAVFDEEPEDINDNGELKQYTLSKDDDSYYIGIDNTGTKKYHLKLILEGLKVNDGPFKGQTEPIFELNPNERKVFDVLITTEEDVTFEFALA